MEQEKASKKKKNKINFIAVEGDVIETVANALNANISSVLAKHGATLTMGLSEIMRNHAKV